MVHCAVIPRVANCVLTCANQICGLEGQKGGSLIETVATHAEVSSAFTGATPIEDLAQLADKIVEVAVPPSISSLSASVQSSEIQQLRTEIASLTKVVQFSRMHQ